MKKGNKVPLSKMKPLTLVNSPGVRNKEKVFELKPVTVEKKTAYKIDDKTVIYISNDKTDIEIENIIEMYKDLKPQYLK